MEPLKKILLCLRNVFTKKDDSVIPTDFSDLAPLDSIDNTSEYLNALDWALKNRRIRNVALCGPYGAGKSSIINSYLKSHADAQQKSLRISMATFIESKTEGSDSSHSVALKPDEIETGILKQLFYKVPHTKIPQSRYRKLHKGGKLIAWRNLVLISIFLLLLGFIFAPDHVINVINILYETWPFSTPPAKVAIVAFAILFTGVLGSIAWCFYPAFSRMKISSISISAKANVEGDEESKESIFNKNMDEIVYFFEETRYRYVFFEDLDRLNDAAIFVRLRELNTLLNNDDEIKDPVVFIYAVRDDIFSNEDRTKFFDFLIPIVPFINSTNSGEELSKRLEASKKKEFLYNISSSFIDDVSPFISDMRILKNIYNEFIIYKNTLQAEPNLELSDESMMALMVFKNLYPKEFAELQKEQGILIDYRHIPFTPDQMKELKKQYPSLQAKFILQNQAAAFSELNSVPMDQNLFQELLLDPRLESQYRQTLFDSYYQKYLNAPIAGKVDELRISVNHDEFEEVWQLLSDGDRENFLLSHLEILNGDDFEKCFAKMEPPFNLLSNRTQRNQVTVPWKNGIKQLLDRLKAVKYITSYTERAAAQQNDGSRQDEKSNSSVYIVRIKVLK